MYEETIDLAHLPPEGLKIERRVHANAWKIDETDWHSRGELHFFVFLNGGRRKVSVQGEFTAGVSAECHRCLKAIDVDLRRSFHLTYLPADPERFAKEEVELESSELEVAYLDQPYLPLHEMIREQIYLGLPMKFLCAAECRGLCPHCGANLNEVECGCAEAAGDPRWASLKAIVHDEK
jgi:uncharacterized protein